MTEQVLEDDYERLIDRLTRFAVEGVNGDQAGLDQTGLRLRHCYQDLLKTNRDLRQLNVKLAGREYKIRDLELQNKLLQLRLDQETDFHRPNL